jgi:hypothetical protein
MALWHNLRFSVKAIEHDAIFSMKRSNKENGEAAYCSTEQRDTEKCLRRGLADFMKSESHSFES